jgi:putative flippase GtrA
MKRIRHLCHRFCSHPHVRKHVSQGLKFAICGGIGASIDLGSLTLFVEYGGIDPGIAFIPSVLLAVIFVFLANKHFTFRNHEKNYGRQAFKFALVYGTAIVFNLSVSWALLWLGLHYLIAKTAAIGIGAVWNYSLSHGFVFKKHERVEAAVV